MFSPSPQRPTKRKNIKRGRRLNNVVEKIDDNTNGSLGQ